VIAKQAVSDVQEIGDLFAAPTLARQREFFGVFQDGDLLLGLGAARLGDPEVYETRRPSARCAQERPGHDQPLRPPAPGAGTGADAAHQESRRPGLCPAPNRGRHRRTPGPDRPLRDWRHRPVPHRQRLPVLLPPGQRHRGQCRQDQGPARGQAGQPLFALGLWGGETVTWKWAPSSCDSE
jgi:hypothetical protein